MRDLLPIARGLLLAGVAASLISAGCRTSSSRATSPPRRPSARHHTSGPARAHAAPRAPAFDVRLLRVQPRAHIGEQHECDVSYVGRISQVGTREERRYPTPVEAHVPVECRTPAGAGWVDLVVPQGGGGRLGSVAAGKRIAIQVVAADGGFADYPIVRLVSVVGAALAAAARPASPFPAVQPGFDFDRVDSDHHLIGSTHHCAVDFVGGIEIVAGRDRRFRRYPTDAQNRMTVKCKHQGGDSWVDLVFTPADSVAALQVEPGETVALRISTAEGGFAGYPVVRWAGPEAAH